MADFTQNRSNYIRIFFVAIPFILIVRLLFLQVFGSGGYKDAAIGSGGLYQKDLPAQGNHF
jgi:hypothetical protein